MAELSEEEKSKISRSVEKTERNAQDIQKIFGVADEHSGKITELMTRIESVEKGLADLFRDKQSLFLWSLGCLALVVAWIIGVQHL